MKKHRVLSIAAAVIMTFAGAACDPFCGSVFCVTAEAASKLGAPENIAASVSGTTVKLKWDKVKGADAYRVFRYNSKTRKYESVKTSAKNSASIKGLAAGTHKFRVAALVKKNGKYSVQTKSAPITVEIAGKEENMTDRITVHLAADCVVDGELCSGVLQHLANLGVLRGAFGGLGEDNHRLAQIYLAYRQDLKLQ